MRAGSLRTLLRELRAGGVSDYTEMKRGSTITLKLVGPFALQPPKSARKEPAKADLPFPPISSALRQQLEQLGVDPDQAHEVLMNSGIGGSGA